MCLRQPVNISKLKISDIQEIYIYVEKEKHRRYEILKMDID